MRERLEEALRKGKADYVEIRVEEVEATAVAFKGKEIDTLSASKVRGGIARAVVRGGWGMAVFNDLKELSDAVRRACELAGLVGREETRLAEVEPVQEVAGAELRGRDFRGVLLDEKVRTAKEYNDIMLGHHPKIESTETRYRDSFRRVWYVNSEGTYIEDERPDISMYMTAIARDGDNVQKVTERAISHGGFETVEGLQERAERAARRAVELLAAPPVRGGVYTVVLDPRLAGVFAHEAFGHLSEADFVYENPRLKELLVLGRRFGVEDVTIVDDGTIPGLYGTIKYDDEGVPAKKTYLLKEGVLVGRLHNRETSAKMGEPLTGNARAQGYSSEPIVRMTNTYIEPGKVPFEDMLSGIKLGVYAVDMVGGQTMMEMFTFSAGWGYMIRDGRIEELVRDVVLTGNLFETLKNIEAVGDDLRWDHGHCGKGGQTAPVSTGSPHIRIRNVVVGGRR